MIRTVQISIFALVCLGGVLAGSLVDDAEARRAVNTQHLANPESPPEIVALTNEVTRLRMIVERDGRHEDDHDDDDDDEPDLEAIIAHDRDIAERRAAAITAAADHEPVDPDWAPTVERQIAEGFAAHGPPGAALVSTICKTTLCIAEIEHPLDDDGFSSVNWLEVFDLSRGFFLRHEPEPGTGVRTVAYLARDGHLLPRAR